MPKVKYHLRCTKCGKLYWSKQGFPESQCCLFCRIKQWGCEVIKVIPAKLLGSLGCYHYKLKAPLEYKIENTQGGVIVFIEGPIFEYGYGKTETEALDDLRASIIDLLNSLRTHSHELGKAPKQELRWLEKNIGILWEG